MPKTVSHINKNTYNSLLKENVFFGKWEYLIVFIGTIYSIIFLVGRGNPVISYVGVTLFVLISVLLKPKNLVYFIVFLLPNQRFFTLYDNDISLLNIVIIFALFKILFNRIKITQTQFIFVLVLLIYSIVSTYKIDNFSNVFIAVKASFLIILLLLVFKNNVNNASWYFNLVLLFALGSMLTGIIGLFTADNFVLGLYNRFSGGDYNNANIFGSMLSFSIANLFVIHLRSKQKNINTLALIFVLVLFGFMTQSRSFVLAVFFGIVYLTFFSLIINKKINLSILLVLLIGFGVGTFIYLYPNSNISKLFYFALDRILNPKSGDITASRFYIWTVYSEKLFSDIGSLFFGVGSSNPHFILGLSQVAHNGLIELIVSWGIIGSTLFIFFFINIWRWLNRSFNIRKTKKWLWRFVGYLPLLILIIVRITGHSIVDIAFIVQLFISYQAILVCRYE